MATIQQTVAGPLQSITCSTWSIPDAWLLATSLGSSFWTERSTWAAWPSRDRPLRRQGVVSECSSADLAATARPARRTLLRGSRPGRLSHLLERLPTVVPVEPPLGHGALHCGAEAWMIHAGPRRVVHPYTAPGGMPVEPPLGQGGRQGRLCRVLLVLSSPGLAMPSVEEPSTCSALPACCAAAACS